MNRRPLAQGERYAIAATIAALALGLALALVILVAPPSHAWFGVRLTGEAVCVDEKPVTDWTLIGDDEHDAVVLSGPFKGPLPAGATPTKQTADTTLSFDVRRDGDGNKTIPVTFTVEPRTDCTPTPEPSPTPTPTPSPTPEPTKPAQPDKPGKCEKRTCARDNNPDGPKKDHGIGKPVHQAPPPIQRECRPGQTCLPPTGAADYVPWIAAAAVLILAGFLAMTRGRKGRA